MDKAVCIWFFGLPCSGKTTIGDKLVCEFKKRGLPVERLDGDIVRGALTRDLGFSMKDRFEHIRRVTWVAKMLMKNGINVIASFITPLRAMRYYIRKELDKCLLVECKCCVETCMKRDVKGLYEQALDGNIGEFTGLTQRYELPINEMFWNLDTEFQAPEESLEELMNVLIDYKVFEYLK
jgi:adenylylsulfate kinase